MSVLTIASQIRRYFLNQRYLVDIRMAITCYSKWRYSRSFRFFFSPNIERILMKYMANALSLIDNVICVMALIDSFMYWRCACGC